MKPRTGVRPVFLLAASAIFAGCHQAPPAAQQPSATDSASVVSIPAHCPDPGARDLVGLWESSQVTKGGIGNTIEFRADGIEVGSLGAIVNMVYRVSGDQLYSGLTSAVDDLVSTWRVEGDTLTETYKGGEVIVKKRFGTTPSSGDAPLVGTWTNRHYTGPMAFTWFTDDGRLLLRIPMRSASQCYTALGSNLRDGSSAGESDDWQFAIDGRNLSLSKQGELTRTYVKAPLVWYDIQHLDVGPAIQPDPTSARTDAR
jgi:hypothetical protein